MIDYMQIKCELKNIQHINSRHFIWKKFSFFIFVFGVCTCLAWHCWKIKRKWAIAGRVKWLKKLRKELSPISCRIIQTTEDSSFFIWIYTSICCRPGLSWCPVCTCVYVLDVYIRFRSFKAQRLPVAIAADVSSGFITTPIVYRHSMFFFFSLFFSSTKRKRNCMHLSFMQDFSTCTTLTLGFTMRKCLYWRRRHSVLSLFLSSLVRE